MHDNRTFDLPHGPSVSARLENCLSQLRHCVLSWRPHEGKGSLIKFGAVKSVSSYIFRTIRRKGSKASAMGISGCNLDKAGAKYVEIANDSATIATIAAGKV